MKTSMRFIDPKSDIAFKKIFGDQNHQEALLEFLNTVLDLPDLISSLEILNPYQAPRLTKLKETLLDVKARDQAGREFIVEMQVEKQSYFAQRTTYYTSKAYASQLKTGESYLNLKPVIFLGLLDFNIFEGENPISCHLILNKENQAHEIKELSFNFIELPKFNKIENQLNSLVDQWLYFFKEAPNLKLVPESVQTKGLKAAYEVAEQHNWSDKELEVYEYWSMKETGRLDAMQTAKAEARAEGEAIGEVRGRAEGKVEGKAEGIHLVAKNMIQAGMSVEQVVAVTQLPQDIVAQIERNNTGND